MVEVEVDRSLFKLIVIIAIGIIFAALFGYGLSRLTGEQLADQVSLVVLTGMLWAALLVLQVFFIKSTAIALQGFILQVAAVVLPLYFSFSWYLFWGAVALVLLLGGGFYRGRSEIRDYIRIHFFRIGAKIVPVFITGIALLVTGYAVGNFATKQFAIPASLFETLLRGATPIVTRFAPGFSPDATVDKALTAFVKTKLPKASEAEIATQVKILKDEIEKQTGIQVEGESSVKESLRETLLKKLNTLTPKMKLIALGIVALLLFLAIKGLAFFFKWIIILLAFVIYRILMSFSFFYVGQEAQQKEVIVVK